MANLYEPADVERDDPPTRQRAREPRRRRRRWVVVTASCLAVLVVATASGWLYLRHLEGVLDANIERFPDPVATVPAQDRPPVTTPGAVNILVIWTDTRVSAADPATWAASGDAVTSVSLVHIGARRHHVASIAIPRDVEVEVPGQGRQRLVTAFAKGGPGLVLRTVEKLSGTRVDHVAIVDSKGLVEVTDALHGVAVPVPARSGTGYPPGLHTMSGQEALDYVHQATPGDTGLQRLARQQAWARAVTKGLLSRRTLSNPVRLTSCLTALSTSVAVDAPFTMKSMRSLALSLRSLGNDDIAFLTVPVRSERAGVQGNKRVVQLDTDAATGLWQALRSDTMARWTPAETAPPGRG